MRNDTRIPIDMFPDDEVTAIAPIETLAETMRFLALENEDVSNGVPVDELHFSERPTRNIRPPVRLNTGEP